MMRTLIVLILIGAVLAVAVPKLLVGVMTDTEYAPGYTEAGFESIELGDNKADVFSALGPPFSTSASTPTIKWLYCDKDHPGFQEDGGISGTFSLIVFSAAGEVLATMGQTETERSSGFFSSSSSVTWDGGPLGAPMGNPMGSPSALKGSTESEIRAKFGSPRHVLSDPETEVLIYSRSPSSTHYLLRSIGLNAAGTVVEKHQYCYWD